MDLIYFIVSVLSLIVVCIVFFGKYLRCKTKG